MYKVEFTSKAVKDLAKLKKSEPSAFKKAEILLLEIAEHPETGTGQIEQLKGNRAGQWSRKISGKHRIVYQVNNEVVEVLILSASGHYGDK